MSAIEENDSFKLFEYHKGKLAHVQQKERKNKKKKKEKDSKGKRKGKKQSADVSAAPELLTESEKMKSSNGFKADDEFFRYSEP